MQRDFQGILQLVMFLGVISLLPGCSSSGSATAYKRSGSGSDYGATASLSPRFVPQTSLKSPATLYREANVRRDLIPRGRHARKYHRSMDPRYITIHSTQNFSSGADALKHSEALKNGKLRSRKRIGGNRIGYLVWHFSVDEDRVVQHLPTNEQGEHADFGGPGNRYSIGIEMCENRGNSRSATIERTAKLTAYLMHEHDIPLRKVVPHYHWPRRGLSPSHKNCPHYLLDNGRPGAKWRWFLDKVNEYYQSIDKSSTQTVSTLSASTRPGAQASPPKPSYIYYIIRKGDTLWGIARKHKTSVDVLRSINKLTGDIIFVGQKLLVPAP